MIVLVYSGGSVLAVGTITPGIGPLVA